MSNKKFSMHLVAAATVLAALASVGQARAGTQFSAYHRASSTVPGASGPALPLASLVINAAGIVSFDGEDATGNTMLTLAALPNSVVDAISYNVTISTFGASWLSDAAVSFTNSAGDGVVLTAGDGNDFAGVGTYADGGSLLSLGLSFNVGADGLLFVQFFEVYDDLPGAADAVYTAGNITFGNIGAVPEPGTYGLMALGLLGVVGVARRNARTALKAA